MSEAEIFFIPPLNPERITEEQLHHFLGYAAFLLDVAEKGGMTPEEALVERDSILRHIGMIKPPEPAKPPRRLYEDREDPW